MSLPRAIATAAPTERLDATDWLPLATAATLGCTTTPALPARWLTYKILYICHNAKTHQLCKVSLYSACTLIAVFFNSKLKINKTRGVET